MKFKLLTVTGLAALGLFLGACGKKDAPASATTPAAAQPAAQAASLSIMATSDLRDAEPLAQMIQRATGVAVSFSFAGTMDSTERVLEGKATADAAWFANAKYLMSDAAGQSKVKLSEKIMYSPIVVGVSQSEVAKLGWTDASKVTWASVSQAAAAGKLRYALSNPATSNQGFTALLGVVAAAAQKTEVLNAQDVDRKAIADFLKGYKLVGDNSTYLSEKFYAQQGTSVNAFINYESWLLTMNQSGKLREPLALFYPKEGISTADYPLLLLNDAKRDIYQKVVTYMKGPEAQSWLARTTLRRPSNTEVAKAEAGLFPQGQTLIELPFSPDRGLADGLIDAYLNEFRTPIASTFVIDVSGSMNSGTRRADLIGAMQFVAGADNSLTGRIARLTSRERIWLQPFSDVVQQPSYFELPQSKATKGVQLQQDSDAKRAVLGEVRDYAQGLQMKGGTALYDAVLQSLKNMHEARQKNPAYNYSVVAFTDGENNKGRDLEQFKRDYAALPEDVKAIPVFMVLFGEANEAALKDLVKTTGGRLFDARKASLSSVFRDIRAFQ